MFIFIVHISLISYWKIWLMKFEMDEGSWNWWTFIVGQSIYGTSSGVSHWLMTDAIEIWYGIIDRDNPHLLLEQVDKSHDLTW